MEKVVSCNPFPHPDLDTCVCKGNNLGQTQDVFFARKERTLKKSRERISLLQGNDPGRPPLSANMTSQPTCAPNSFSHHGSSSAPAIPAHCAWRTHAQKKPAVSPTHGSISKTRENTMIMWQLCATNSLGKQRSDYPFLPRAHCASVLITEPGRQRCDDPLLVSRTTPRVLLELGVVLPFSPMYKMHLFVPKLSTKSGGASYTQV